MQVFVNKNFEEELKSEFEVHMANPNVEIDLKLDAQTAAEPGNTTEPDRQQLIKCRYCERYFFSAQTLNTHMNSYHPDQPMQRIAELETKTVRKFQCPECDKTFTALNSLKRHVRNHTGDKPFKCRVCSKTFTRKDYLSAHEMIHFIKTTKKKPC